MWIEGEEDRRGEKQGSSSLLPVGLRWGEAVFFCGVCGGGGGEIYTWKGINLKELTQ